MSKGYNSKETEKKIRQFWEKEKIYKFNPDSEKKVFSIDTPPPFVSGKMHIGHALMYSQMDFIARFMRLYKKNVFYPFGTDDNGLPTERFVEKLNNVKSHDMPRTEFIKLCLKTLKKTTFDFVGDWIKLGISCDWGLVYSTIDDNSRKISQKSFIHLYKKAEIYKKKFPTLWCSECQTAIAQAELEDKEKQTDFVYINAELEGGGFLTFATTRPELLHSCVCITVHPEDERYKLIVGKKAKIPISNKWVPVIVDKFTKKDFGTGAVYWCPYGDKSDLDFLARHPEFKPNSVLTKDGKLNDVAREYRGLSIKEARKKIISHLQRLGVVDKLEKINHVVNVHERCGIPIEILETEQWFTKILDKKRELIKQGRKINWYPSYMRKRYENWIKGLRWDWNISRNRFFGVPIPVWECKKCGKIILPLERELPVDPIQLNKKCTECGLEAQGESMVLDTWATSSLTPQIASDLVGNKIKIPYSLRPQGHDIIRTWAFYTIVKSYLHYNKIPWRDIIITGNVSLGGEKMSKSKGNVIMPQDVMNKFSSDSLRYWAAGSRLGSDLDYHEKDLVTGEKLIKKLLNATRFVFMNLGKTKPKKPRKLEKVDELLLTKLNQVIKSATDSFKIYEYSRAKQEVEKFFWNDFCDNYLEIIKERIYHGGGNQKMSAHYTLYEILLVILKMISPIMPFVAEEIYQRHFKKFEKDKSIHMSKWPEFKKTRKKTIVEKYENGELGLDIWRLLLNVISKVRQEKSQNQKPMNAGILLTLTRINYADLRGVMQDLKAVTNSREIKQGSKFSVEFL